MSAVVQHTAKQSLVSKMAARFGVEPEKMMVTLKSTAFKGEVTNEQMMALLIVADQYGLNPWTKEIYAFPDKGGIVPVVGVDGWSRIINQDPNFDGMEFEQDEEKCTCIIYRKDRAHAIKVTEYLAECIRPNVKPWETHPKRMLRHKALIQCARLAFGFVGIYDQDEAERIIEAEVIRERKTITPTAGVWDSMNEDMKTYLTDLSNEVKARIEEGNIVGANETIEMAGLDADQTTALWTRFDSKQRSAMKRAQKSPNGDVNV